ncbi:MAG TPA: Spy/CpxP family protein refolding chaperone [Ramlibacter sp.]|nr:Spy/CpxP family protein refolding chaperone [Ramlibacter sp.]
MTFVHKHIAAAVMLAAAGLTATAQTTPAPATPPAAEAKQYRMDPAKRLERFNQRMAELKQKLQITGAQESAWTHFANAMRPDTNRPRVDREALAQLSTPDRIDQMRALRQQRMAEMDRRGDATKAFYNALTTEQKKVFDTETAQRGHRGHGRPMRG